MLAHLTTFDLPSLAAAFATGLACGAATVLGAIAWRRNSGR